MVGIKKVLICLAVFAGCGSCGEDSVDGNADRGPDSGSDSGLVDLATPDSGADGGTDSGVDDVGNPNPVLFIPEIDELDDTFGNGGLSTVTSAPGGFSTIWDLDVQDDGKIVGFGRNFESAYVFRLTANGRRDPSFGNAGIAYLPFGERTFGVVFKVGNIEIGPDNTIFVSHWFSPFSRLIGNGYVAKLDSTGTLDTDFADDGVYRSGFREFSHGVQLADGSGRYISGPSVSITGLDGTGAPDNFELAIPEMTQVFEFKQLDDGSWLGAGNVTNRSAALIKLTADWRVDTAFGEQGQVIVEQTGNGIAGFWDFAIDSQGRIVAVGAKEIAENQNGFAVARFTANGSLDTTFGDAGWVQGAGRGLAFGVEVIDGDRIIVVGDATMNDAPTGVVQLEEDGSVGWSSATILSALAIAPAGDGSMLVGGGNLVSKIGLDGSLDSSFGDNGNVSLSGAHTLEFGSVAFEEGERLLVSGTVDGVSSSLAWIQPDGTIDEDSGLPPRAIVPMDVKSIAKATDGRYLLGGRKVNENDFFFSKLLADNTVERVTLSIPNTVVAWPFDTQFFSNDEVYTVGIFGDGAELRMGVVKSDENGVIDTTFGTEGRASGEVPPNTAGTFDDAQVFREQDGKITARYNDRVYRFNPDGTPDVNVTGGFVTGYEWLHQLEVDRYLARVAESDPVQIVRLLNDFTVDPTFNGGSAVTLDTNAYFDIGFVVKNDGSFFVLSATGGPLTTNGYVASVNADGTFDNAFGTGGELNMKMSEYSSSLESGFVNASGQLVGIGHAWTFNGGSDIAVVRFD